MARIEFESTPNAGGGFTLLPDGIYHWVVDAIEEKVSTKKNQQLVFKLHVIDGPFAGHKATHWHTMTANNGFKTAEVLTALLNDDEYDKEETGEERERTLKGGKVIKEPVYKYGFDYELMVGRTFKCDVTSEPSPNDPKKIYNRLNNWQPLLEDDAPAAPAPTPAPAPKAPARKAAAAPAAQATTLPTAAPTQAAPAAATRRRIAG